MSEYPIIRIEEVSQKYGKRTVLYPVSLSLQKGEILGLLGPSGSGKTTLVRAIAGISRPTRGRVRVLGHKMPSYKAIAKVGYMAQADALYVDMSGFDNLTFFAELYGLTGHQKRRRIHRVVELTQMGEAIKRPVHTYSGGMKRRLSLAVALIHDPEVLILDEPTVGIDPLLRQSFWAEFIAMKSRGVSIIITTHVMDEAAHCDRLAMIREGRLIAEGEPEALMRAAEAVTLEEAFMHYGGVRK